MKRIFPKGGHHPDYFLLAVIFILTIGGLAILTGVSSYLGAVKFNDSYYYLKHQVYYGLSLGIIGFLLAYKIPYRYYRRLAFPFLLINLALLGLVFTKLGVHSGGATRWLALGPVQFQPAELLKLSFIMYVAAFFSNPRFNRAKNLTQGLLPFLGTAGVTAALLVIQPATSTVVILLTSGLVIYFLSGAEWKHMFAIVGVGLALLIILVTTTSYRLGRVMSWLHPAADNQGQNYHLNQALIALGSGGIFGRGYGQSVTELSRLPEAVDDSIFAAAGRDLGFIGAFSILVIFAIFIFRMFWLAKETRDRFGKYILIGFAMIVALQSLVHIGAISGLLPLTGVPLPFISYGGTALAVFLTMSGIAVNISRYT